MKSILILILVGILVSSCTYHNKPTTLETIRKDLQEVYIKDQKYRVKDYDKNFLKQESLDIENLKIVSKIIDSLGWLSEEIIGDTANAALFLVIQHSNKSTMEKYLPSLRKAVEEKKAKKQNLALLIDRIEMLNNRKQIYGSQVIKKDSEFILYDVIEPKKINERRAEMGLGKIEDYLGEFTK